MKRCPEGLEMGGRGVVVEVAFPAQGYYTEHHTLRWVGAGHLCLHMDY